MYPNSPNGLTSHVKGVCRMPSAEKHLNVHEGLTCKDWSQTCMRACIAGRVLQYRVTSDPQMNCQRCASLLTM